MKSEVEIIYQDKDLLLISKPAGMVCNRAQSVKALTLQDWLEENDKFKISNFKNSQNSKEFILRSGLVHRLDKETSGIMVVSLNPQAFENLKNQFKARTIVKKYLTLVHGKVNPLRGDIQAPLKRNPFNRFRFGVFVDGRPATTNYQILGYYQNPREKNKSKKYFSLVEVLPKTGRTHQIRVHFSHLHHPIVADDLYAGRKTARSDRGWCPRLFLHAQYLSFQHPESTKKMEFESPLPEDLQTALEKREKIPEVS